MALAPKQQATQATKRLHLAVAAKRFSMASATTHRPKFTRHQPLPLAQIIAKKKQFMTIDKSLAARIDHSVLKADTTNVQIKQLCAEAIDYQFVAVCVPPYYVTKAATLLTDSRVKVATVIGFPMGYALDFGEKKRAIKNVLKTGATEVDLVLNIAAIKNAEWGVVRHEFQQLNQLRTLPKYQNIAIKTIIEQGLLTESETLQVCQICNEYPVDFVKTSTGFNGQGATLEGIHFLRKNLDKNIKIKASGGIRTRDFAVQLVEAGADRLGCSKGISIVTLSDDF